MAAALILAKQKQDQHHPRRGAGHVLEQEDKSVVKGLGADFNAPEAFAEQFVRGERKRVGVLYKMVVASDIAWVPRELTITDHALYIAESGNPKFLDFIPLVDVIKVGTFQVAGTLDGAGSEESAEPREPQKSARARRSSRVQSNYRSNPRHKLDHGTQLTGIKRQDSPAWSNLEGDPSFLFEVCTRPDGHNSGRVYRFKASGFEEMETWIADIEQAAKTASLVKSQAEKVNTFEKLRTDVERIYELDASQMVVGALIVLNFVVSAFDAELLPEEGTREKRAFEIFELTFTCVFSVELLVNLFVHWWRPFFKDAWNVFDGIVIVASLAAIAFDDIPGFNLFRLVRILRVLRVFKRLSSLRRIVNALSSSVLPMLNAFTVLFLITAIYAILAVDIYKDQQPVLFGSFLAAFFTMFQVCTMDGWATDIARELSDDKSVSFTDGLFFVSFVVVVGIVILNVVVAVLLDEFVESVSKDRDERLEQRLQEQQKHRASYGSPLDPVLAALAHFNTNDDLSKRIQTMFQMFDVDKSNMLTYNDLMCGLRKLEITPKIHLSKEDFDIITSGEGILNANNALGPTEFERVMRTELQRHVQRHLAHQMMSASASGSQIAHVLFVLKLMMVHFDELTSPSDSSSSASPTGSLIQFRQAMRDSLPSVREQDQGSEEPRAIDSLAHAKLDKIIHLLGGTPVNLPERTESAAGPATLDRTDSTRTDSADSVTPRHGASRGKGRLVLHGFHSRQHQTSMHAFSKALNKRGRGSPLRLDRRVSPPRARAHRDALDDAQGHTPSPPIAGSSEVTTLLASSSLMPAEQPRVELSEQTGDLASPNAPTRLLGGNNLKGAASNRTQFSARSASSAVSVGRGQNPIPEQAERDNGGEDSWQQGAVHPEQGQHSMLLIAGGTVGTANGQLEPHAGLCVPMEVVPEGTRAEESDSDVGSEDGVAVKRLAVGAQRKEEPQSSLRRTHVARSTTDRENGNSVPASSRHGRSAQVSRERTGAGVRRRSSPDPRSGKEPRRPSFDPPLDVDSGDRDTTMQGFGQAPDSIEFAPDNDIAWNSPAPPWRMGTHDAPPTRNQVRNTSAGSGRVFSQRQQTQSR